MNRSERKIITRCIELCSARGYGLAFALVGKREDAEDLVQEALMIAMRKVGELSNRPWPWLAATITNLARNHRRKAQRRGPNVALRDDQVVDEETPLETALKRELSSELMTHFHGLKESEREVLALVYLAGLSLRQAAKQRQQSYSAFRRELEAALGKLSSKMRLPNKTLLAALPLLGITMPGAAFAASLGSSAALPAASLSTFGGTTIGTIIGGVVMKKSVAAIIIILLLLTGGGAWFVWGGGDDPAPRLAAADKSKIEQERRREGDSEEADLGKKRNAEPERVLPIVSDDANDSDTPLIQDASETESSEERGQVEEGKPSDFAFTVLVCDDSGTYPPVGLPNALAEWVTSKGEKKRAEGNEKGEMFLDLGETRMVTFSAPGKKSGRRLYSTSQYEKYGFSDGEKRIHLGDDIPDNIVQVRCLDAAKQPVVGLHVSFNLIGDHFPRYLDNTSSDSTGIATLRIYGKTKWSKNMQLGVQWMDKGYGTSPWISTPLPEEFFNGPVFDLQLPEATRIHGRVLKPNGSPAIDTEVSVYNYTQTHPGAYSSLWCAGTRANADGVFSLFCSSADRVDAQASWKDEYGQNREVGESEMIDTKGARSVDVGIIQMEPQLRTRFMATLNGEPVEGAEIEMRNTPSNIGGIGTYTNGGRECWYWTRSQVLAHPKVMEIRFKHRAAYSEWIPIRDKVLNEEVILGELVPISFGTVTFSYSAKIHELSVTAYSERDSHLPRFLLEVADESGQIELPVGKWNLRIKARARVGDHPDLIAPLENVTIIEGQDIRLSISLVKQGMLTFTRPAAPAGASLRTSVIYPNKNFLHIESSDARDQQTVTILPNTPISLHIRYFRDGALAEKDIELKPFEPGEEREMDFAKEIAAVIAEIDGD